MKTLFWTNHSRAKMRQYKLSESRIKRVLNNPKRIEGGIVDKTVVLMQSAGTLKHPYEIWVMAQDTAKRRKIISVWRYPGKTKPGAPLPEGIIREFREILDFKLLT